MLRERLLNSTFNNMPKLGVNIDHVATLREARRGKSPNPVTAALACEDAGADSIVAHLREDRRHIKDKDIFQLNKSVRTKFNLEMSIASEIVEIAARVRPDQATLVPEKRLELTTEGGLDVVKNFRKVKQVIKLLGKNNINVSLFIDPVKLQIEAAQEAGAGAIEIHTGCFAHAKSGYDKEKCFRQIESATGYALDKGLIVNAGHGLDYDNVIRIAKIKGIEELNIGYSIICRAIFVGLQSAVSSMKELI